MKLICKLIKQGVATTNGRVYSPEALARIATLSNHQTLNGTCFLGADVSMEASMIRLSDVAGRVHLAEVVDGQLQIEVELLETAKGTPLLALTTDALQRTFSVVPVMYGTTSDGMNVDPYTLAVNGWALVK